MLRKYLLPPLHKRSFAAASIPNNLQRCVALSLTRRRDAGSNAATMTNAEVRSAYKDLRALDGQTKVLEDLFGDDNNSTLSHNNYVRTLKFMFDRVAWSASSSPPRKGSKQRKDQQKRVQKESLQMTREIFAELKTLHQAREEDEIRPLSKSIYARMVLALCTAAVSTGQAADANAWDEAIGVVQDQLEKTSLRPSPSIFSRLLLACPLTRVPDGIHDVLGHVVATDMLSEQSTYVYNTALASLNRAGLYEETMIVWHDELLRPSTLIPDKYTMSLVVSACTKAGQPEEALKQIDRYFAEGGDKDLVLLNSALLAAARACDMVRAQKYVHTIRTMGAIPDSYTMHSLLLSLATNDRPADALSVLCDWQDNMHLSTTSRGGFGTSDGGGSSTGSSIGSTGSTGGPTTMSFNILLQACSDSCDRDTADQVLMKMKEMKIVPDQNSHDLVIDILGPDQEKWASFVQSSGASVLNTVTSSISKQTHTMGSGGSGEVVADENTTYTYVNVRNMTVAKCRTVIQDNIRSATVLHDMIIITGFGNMHETSVQVLNDLNIEFDTAPKQQRIGRITVPSSEIVQYGIRMENQSRNEEVLRSSLVRIVGALCLVGLPLFGNPIILFLMQ